MSGHSLETFTLNTVGVMAQEVNSRLLIQQTDQSICTSFENTTVKETSIFVYKHSRGFFNAL